MFHWANRRKLLCSHRIYSLKCACACVRVYVCGVCILCACVRVYVCVRVVCVRARARARVCSLSYPACNAHAPYCHLWSPRLYSIFPLFLINGKIFGEKKLLETKCAFSFSLQLTFETFLILRRTERDKIKKNVYWSSCKVHKFLSDCTEP
jgi:hypothetical protein